MEQCVRVVILSRVSVFESSVKYRKERGTDAST